MARYTTTLTEVGGSEGYILEVALEETENPLLEMELADVATEIGTNQLYVRTDDSGQIQQLLHRIERQRETHPDGPFLVLLTERPAEAESGLVVDIGDIETAAEAKQLLHRLVQRLYSEASDSNGGSWSDRLDSFRSQLATSVGLGADAITYVEQL